MLRTTSSSRVLLVADRRRPADGLAATPVRRFRIARLNAAGRTAPAPARLDNRV